MSKDCQALINRALDALKDRLDLPSDSALAEHLRVSRQMLSQMRSGETRVPARLLDSALDRAEFAITRDGVISLLPKDTVEVLRRHDNGRFARRAQVVEDARLANLFGELDHAKVYYDSDELADAIAYYLSKNRC